MRSMGIVERCSPAWESDGAGRFFWRGRWTTVDDSLLLWCARAATFQWWGGGLRLCGLRWCLLALGMLQRQESNDARWRRHRTPAAALLAHARVSGQGSGCEAMTFYRAEVAAALACGSREHRVWWRQGLELGLVSSLGTTEGRRW
jgi:hypothetical protein